MVRKTILQIIEETELVYSDPSKRGYDAGKCQYLTEDGKMCAVGRCMIEPGLYKYSLAFLSLKTDNINVEPKDIIRIEHDTVLKEEYRGHSFEFWQDLQGFHDSSKSFTSKGISEWGYDNLINIAKQHYNKQ